MTTFPWETAQPSNFVAALKLEGRNGYSIGVEGWGHNVKLVASRESHSEDEFGGSASGVEYLTRGTATKQRIEAKFGELGEISVEFKPSRKLKKVRIPIPLFPQRSCGTTVGPDTVGVFVGRIEFTGENGYTAVHAHRAKGIVGALPKVGGCKDSTSATPKGLSEESHSETRSLYFMAGPGSISSGSHTTRFAAFLAGSLEEGEMMTISRTALAIARSNTFLADYAIGSATASPPAPFSGTGVFQTNADRSTSWSGSLAVSFPGEEAVALAGPEFSGSLTR